jgi:pyruvate dehydrogenase E2 component (dihydrolipoamide acetyltransferase)
MPINILMPALSPTMEKGNLAKWIKKEGDKIKPGDVIAEIETDKATMEVESVDEGIIAKILVAEGTADVAVNTLIAIVAAEGEDVAAAAASGGAAAPKAAPSAAPVAASPSAGQVSPSMGHPAPSASHPGSGGTSVANTRVFASPLAKRLAKQAGLDIASIRGSGPHGRVVAADVESAKSSGKTAASAAPSATTGAPSAAPAPQGLSDSKIKALYEEGSYDVVPHDGMRKVIASRLLQSKQTVPHFYLTVDCELDSLLALREQINAAAPIVDDKPAYKASVNDFVIKAMALALMRVPEANVSWTDDAMLKHKHADVGVAVSIPGGLITPVVRKAETKTISAISNEMKDFAARAKARKLKPEEYQGGSTAVSNLGMFGIKNFSAIINPPHATILAVGAGEKRAIIRKNEIVAATVMSVTLSTDHRAVDGALGAELISAFKTLIENPMSMLV